MVMKTALPFMLLAATAVGQDVQWASELLRYSSQHSPKQFSAKQVLGKPNVPIVGGSSPVAWAPSMENGGMEYVHVRFREPIHVRQIAVDENLNPGAIHQIFLFDSRRRQHKVYQNDDMVVPLAPEGRMFRHLIPRTDYLVTELKLVLRTDAVPGSNQIDAIGISASDESIVARINEVPDPSFIPKPESLGPMLNSEYDDMLPIISPDGKELYFGRKFSHENTGPMRLDDIYFSKLLPDGTWSKAVNIGPPLNNEYPNYVCAVSPDGNQLVLANEYNPTGGLTQGVSIATRGPDGSWGKPRDLRIKSFYNLNNFSCYHMNPDMNIVLMAIERHDTYGDMDIYVSFKIDGWNWSEPKNLGPTVNSAATEGSVFIAADNRSIFFCSDGFRGYGSFDMFMSRRLDDTWTNWTEPVNLGPHINSRQRDFYYTIPASGDYAYYSSDQNSMGKSDLFRIRLPDAVKPLPVTFLKTKPVDAITGKPLDVPVTYRVIGVEGTFDVQDDDGQVVMILPRKDATTITIDVPGYFPATKDLSLQNDLPHDDLLDYDETDEAERLLREVKAEVRDDVKEEVAQRLDTASQLTVAKEMEAESRRLDSLRHADEQAQRRKQALIDAAVKAAKEEKEQKIAELRKEMQQQAEAEVRREEAEKLKSSGEYREMTDDIELIPIREGQIVRLDNIWFDANQWTLRPESTIELDRVADFLKNNSGIYVEIGGHTNGLPSHDFCDELSDNRAKAVMDYLVAAGADARRITSRGYGKRLPVATNDTLAGRKKNQRVELKILRVE